MRAETSQIGDRGNRKRSTFGMNYPPNRMLIILLGALFAFAVVAPADAKNEVWFETPIAEVSVGYDPSTHLTWQRAFYLAYVGPEGAVVGAIKDREKAMTVARACAEITVKPLRTQLVNRIQFIDQHRNDDEPIEQRTDDDIKAANSALLGVALYQPGNFYKCSKDRGVPIIGNGQFFLSLVQRDCTATYCPLSKSRERLSDDPQAAVFGYLYRWMVSRGAVEQREKTGLHFRLDTLTQPDKSVSLTADVDDAIEVNQWPAALTSDQSRYQFISLLSRVRDAALIRKGAPRISAYAGLVAHLSRSDFVRVADALADSVEGYALADPSKADILSGISNETARSQILECRYFRGATDAASASTCTGYSIDSAIIKSCLSGAICDPFLPEAIQTKAILTGVSRSLNQIAGANPLPRIVPTNMGSYAASYSTCLASDAKSAVVDQCLVAKVLATDNTIASVKDCITIKTGEAQAACALERMHLPPVAKVPCAALGDNRSAEECVLSTYLPEPVKNAYQCASPKATRSALSQCVARVTGGEVGRIAGCEVSSAGDRLALASCVLGDHLPTKTRELVGCISANGFTAEGVAGCALKGELPPEAAVAVGCVTQTHGDPYGAGVCIATSRMNLTANQQLALECLTTSGGQPEVFAACFAGNLTMQELVKCKGKGFGEGDCFGHNNEIQKFARALTGSDIGPNTVVGQIVTINMQPAVVVMSLTQPVVDFAQRTITATISSVMDDAQKATHGDIGGLASLAVAPIVAPVQAFLSLF